MATNQPFTKGRWYRIELASTKTKISIKTTSLADVQISDNMLIMPDKFVLNEVKFDIEITTDTDPIKITVGNKIELPAAGTFKKGYVYLFGYNI